MSEGALRGTRLGATSYETDSHVEMAPRQPISYDCPKGHVTTMPFSLEAEIPSVWECRCGETAIVRGGERPVVQDEKVGRTHWDMLIERRSLKDLQVLLDERLDLLRSGRATESAGRTQAPRKQKAS